MFRFSAGPVWSGLDADRFTPTDWLALDNSDVDIGSSGPMLVDLPGTQLAVEMGKNGKVYHLDRTNLGGLSSSLFSQVVSTGKLMNGPATVQDAAGTTGLVQTAFGSMTECAGRERLVRRARLYPGSPPSSSVAWCGPANGQGSPMVTSTDGNSNAIAWLIGAEGDERLHGFDADTGAVVFAGGGAGDAMGTVQHFNTPIVAHGWIYVGGNGPIYGFHP